MAFIGLMIVYAFELNAFDCAGWSIKCGDGTQVGKMDAVWTVTPQWSACLFSNAQKDLIVNHLCGAGRGWFDEKAGVIWKNSDPAARQVYTFDPYMHPENVYCSPPC